ncbi:uncharacterized protein cubi_00941 [Cryptosporidium ubiquitum]|uniref:Uncharacterized protein n=1 Tax=Cryptosporidium ubiquitum TaxID=857276 RepID=A0A1J4MCQ9_9CRYT|nr:uncharacterized protein cubi_00941 [Cryptosporidium ubiquitum]OII70796.1 hypothetical protein cubi_00941 [Cryptosporidium ubiquitum]
MEDGFDEISPSSSQISNEDVFNIEEEMEFSGLTKDYSINTSNSRVIENEESGILNNEMVDLVLDYVSYKVGEGSNATGIEKVDSTIQNCRNSGFKKSTILNYLVNSGYLDLNEGGENGESVEDSLSYIQSMLHQKSKYIPENVEEITLAVSSATKLFILELMGKINKQLNESSSNKKLITTKHIYDAYISQKKLIPDL